ncbi:MAG: glycosyltransferase [Acidimicrobiales bacterium]
MTLARAGPDVTRQSLGNEAGGPARVLWLAKGLGRGGTERLLAGALHHVDRDRFHVEVAYVLPWKDALVPEIEAADTEVHCLGRGSGRSPGWPNRLRRLIAAGNFDIVHTHMPYPAVAARLAVRGPRPVLVHTEHNLWSRYRWPTYWSNALTYHRNDAVLAVSQKVAESVTAPRWKLGRAMPPVEVLVHGIDPAAACRGQEARAKGRARLGIDLGSVVVGTVGNFTAKKDHLTLLRAVSLLVGAGSDLILVLVGSGPLEPDLRAAVHGLGLETRVRFAGSRDDVLEILPAFDVFALSSRHEGLPIALLEAMASGVPCVATRVGGIPEVLDDGIHGLLVAPADPSVLADALGILLADRGLRAEMGARAAERGSQFDLAPAISRLQDVYERVLVTR